MKTWRIALAVSMAAVCLTGAVAQDDGALITLDLKDAELPSAIHMLMSEAGRSYVLAYEAQPTERVTVHFVDMPLDDALRQMLSSHGLVYTVEPGGIYVIRKKTESHAEPPGLPPREPSDTVEPAEAVRVEKIKLTYTDPYEIWAVLTGEGSGNTFEVPGLTGLWPYRNDNSLIAKFGGMGVWGSVGQGPRQPPAGPQGLGPAWQNPFRNPYGPGGQVDVRRPPRGGPIGPGG